MFSEYALKFSPWSYSKVDKALRCPRDFNLSYGPREPGTGKPPQVRGVTLIGQAVHSVLDQALRGTNLRDAIVNAGIKHKLTTNEIDDVLSYTHSMERFLKRFESFKQSKNLSDVATERKFGLTVDMGQTNFFGKDVFFRGVWDIIARAGDYIIVLDHKSGDVEPVEKYDDQLQLYAIAAVNLFDGVKGVQSAIHYVQSEEIVWAPMRTTDQILATLMPWYCDWIERAAKNALLQAATKNDKCQYCAYITGCPAHNR